MLILRFQKVGMHFSAQCGDHRRISNPTLANRTLTLDFKMPWRILAQSGIASRRDAEFPTEFSRNDFRRCILDEVRTFFRTSSIK